MEVKCEYCGAFISENEEFCSQCGAVNAQFKRATDGTPRTIEELKAWYESKNLPPQEVTRFFIGVNCKEPRAFGIYKEAGKYIVYKNKDDGTRAIRYDGKDEAYAVNELYLKLKSEILNQKAHNMNQKAAGNSKKRKSSKVLSGFGVATTVVCVAVAAIVYIYGAILYIRDIPYAGNYYGYGSDVYYCDSYVDDTWYLYDSYSGDYVPSSIPTEMYDDIQSYKFSKDDEWEQSIVKFEDSETGQRIEAEKSSSSSSDDDYSWSSSDSWDSGSTDWGSDW